MRTSFARVTVCGRGYTLAQGYLAVSVSPTRPPSLKTVHQPRAFSTQQKARLANRLVWVLYEAPGSKSEPAVLTVACLEWLHV